MGLGLILDSTKADDPDPVSETGRVKGRKRRAPVGEVRVVRKSKKRAKIEAITIGNRIHLLSEGWW